MRPRDIPPKHPAPRRRAPNRLAWSLAGILCAAAGVAVLLGLPAAAQSGNVCVPKSGQYPPLSGQSPNWWSTAAAAAPLWIGPGTDAQPLGDPRWAGAYGQTYPLVTGSAEDAMFRAMYDGSPAPKRLFLSWNAEAAPFLDAPKYNEVFVGFSPGYTDPGTGPMDVVIHIKKDTKTTANPALDAATNKFVLGFDNFTTEFYTNPTSANGTGTWTQAATLPPWLAPPTTGVQRVWQQPGQWMAQMVIPISGAGLNSGLNLPPASNFKMWYELQIAQPTGGVNSDPGVTRYKWPDTAADLGNTLAGYQPPPTAQWGAAATGGCTTAGVSIGLNDVGTQNTPISDIKYPYPPSPGTPAPNNVFFASPTNGMTSTDIPIGGLKATFRIANWGSQTLTSWQAIPPGVPPETGGTDVKNQIAIPHGTKAANAITFNWTLTDPQAANMHAVADATGRSHQCMLVEFSGTGAVPVTFANSSVARNMDFVTASKFERDCEINVKGLAPIAGGGPNRKVYLYVETRNMPAEVKAPPPTTDKVPVRTPPPGEPAPPIRPELERFPDREPPPPLPPDWFPAPRQNLAGFTPPDWKATPRGEVGGPLVLPDPLADMPAYIVHVYHETGKTVLTNGTKTPVLEAQTAFGYFVSHTGPLWGWKHELTGAKEIAPNYYEVEAPNDGAAHVTTVIEALESAPPPPPGSPGSGGPLPWWVWLILALLVLLILLLILWAVASRKPGTP
jgi:hypothetical protein